MKIGWRWQRSARAVNTFTMSDFTSESGSLIGNDVTAYWSRLPALDPRVRGRATDYSDLMKVLGKREVNL